jgi:hypothetical protein
MGAAMAKLGFSEIKFGRSRLLGGSDEYTVLSFTLAINPLHFTEARTSISILRPLQETVNTALAVDGPKLAKVNLIFL